MEERRLLLLATAIVEYQGVLDHMSAIEQAGVRVPFAIVGRTRAEQRRLCVLWAREQGNPMLPVPDEVVRECRTYVTAHQEMLTELDTTWEHQRPQQGNVSDVEQEETDE
jgi:hypothetical protein